MTQRRWSVIWLLSLLCAFQALAQVGSDQDLTPPRLSYVDGVVSFWRPGAEDWVAARLNTPLAVGDGLYTGQGGSFELQLGSRAFVRADRDTQLTLVDHKPDLLQFRLTGGRVSFDLRELPAATSLEIDTPAAVFTIQNPGYYRVEVADETYFITRRGGVATIIPSGGEAQGIQASEQVVVQGGRVAQVTTYVAPEPDQWDRWNYARTEDLIDSISARYLSPDVAGADDLDRHGAWRVVPEYGAVWVPDGIPSGWAPYSTGSWVWDPIYEWTWIDDAPWGWAPYHYGRWLHIDGYWAWAPGPVIAHRPHYSPALVAFFGVDRDIAIRLRLGSPGVCWVALGWGEPLQPWWGRPEYRGRSTWRGWGGPRHARRGMADDGRTHHHNASVPHAVVYEPEGQFGRMRGTTGYRRLDRAEVLIPIRGELPIKPNRESLVGAAGKGVRPPPALVQRPVVAAHPAPELKRPWRADSADEGKAIAPPTRYVVPSTRPWSELPRPRFGSQGEGVRERYRVAPGASDTRERDARRLPVEAPAPTEVKPRPQGPGARGELPPPRAVMPEVRMSAPRPEREAAPRRPQEAQPARERHDAEPRREGRGDAASQSAPIRRGDDQLKAPDRLPGNPANQTYRQRGPRQDEKGH